MTVNKAELINQITSNSGLKGKALEDYKKQLQAKSLPELSGIISNSKPKEVGFKNFVELPTTQGPKPGNVFGSGFGSTGDYFGFSTQNNAPVYTPAQAQAMKFLKGMLEGADSNMLSQYKSDGAVAKSYNFFKEILNTEHAKSNVKDTIEGTDAD